MFITKFLASFFLNYFYGHDRVLDKMIQQLLEFNFEKQIINDQLIMDSIFDHGQVHRFLCLEITHIAMK